MLPITCGAETDTFVTSVVMTTTLSIQPRIVDRSPLYRRTAVSRQRGELRTPYFT
jgi:hypothetical protein